MEKYGLYVICDVAVSQAEDMWNKWGVLLQSCREKKKLSIPGESASDFPLSTQDKTRRCLKESLDSLGVELKIDFQNCKNQRTGLVSSVKPNY